MPYHLQVSPYWTRENTDPRVIHNPSVEQILSFLNLDYTWWTNTDPTVIFVWYELPVATTFPTGSRKVAQLSIVRHIEKDIHDFGFAIDFEAPGDPIRGNAVNPNVDANLWIPNMLHGERVYLPARAFVSEETSHAIVEHFMTTRQAYPDVEWDPTLWEVRYD